MENQLLKAALWYLKKGMNVIPIKQDKKPYIKWERFQTEQVTESQVMEWWEKWPTANIGVITGKISNMMSVDCDSQNGIDTINEYLPDMFTTPTAKTPSGGQHSHFIYRAGLVNRSRVLTDTDIRTDGGYIVMPPSKNGKGEYLWLPGLKISEVALEPMPEVLFNALIKKDASYNERVFTRGGITSEAITNDNKHNIHNISFDEGSRDESLFHVANSLIRGGMDKDNALKCLQIIASGCNPPFPEIEISTKIESAIKRLESSKRNLTAEVREWISITWDNISITEALQNITNITSADRPKVTVIMNRLVNEGVLERVPGKNGIYRKVENECDAMDFVHAETKSLDLWLPFNIHHLVEIMPGNIILLAGSPNAGKTGLLLNAIQANQKKFEIHYFNSEMGSGELKKRLMLFEDMSLDSWKFKAWERSSNFADVIKPGEGKLNIIDFLEIHENFYEIGGKLAEIHNKLKGAIAIVALQKNKGSDTGLGGFRSLEKPRLYLSMESGALKILKAKNWKGGENPNGKQVLFKVVNGCKFIQTQAWHYPPPNGK